MYRLLNPITGGGWGLLARKVRVEDDELLAPEPCEHLIGEYAPEGIRCADCHAPLEKVEAMPKKRRVRFLFDDQSLVSHEQLDAHGVEIVDITRTDPMTGTMTPLSIPKLAPCCPTCGRPREETP